MLVLCFTVRSQAQLTVTVSGAANASPALSGSYPSLGAALTDVNAITALTGPVVLNLAAGAETAPAGGFTLGSASLNAVLSATNTLTISGTAATVTLNAPVGTSTPGSAAPDGIFKITGADFVTVDGITFTDGNAANPATMEFGLAMFKLSATDGAQNNTVQNCVFNMQRINNATGSGPMVEGAVGILIVNSIATTATTAITPTAATGTNSQNKIYGNTINGGNYGIVISGYAATVGYPLPPLGDVNNDIGGIGSPSATTGNTILNFGGGATANPAAGIRVLNQWGLNISNNIVNNNNGSGVNHATTLRGIYGQSGTSANVTISYNTVTVKSAGTTSALTAIDNAIGSTANSNTVTITNNLIQNCTYTSATTATFSGILAAATATNQVVNNNTITNNTVGTIATTSSPIFQGIYSSVTATNFTANSNVITNNAILKNFGTMYCIRASTSTLLFDQNVIVNNGFPNNTGATSATVYGFYDGASPVNETYTNNTIDSLYITGSSTATSNNVGGIYNTTATGTKIFTGNTISNLSFTSSSTGYAFVSGIRNAYTATSTIAANKIYNLSSTGATPTVAGLYLGSTTGTTYNVYNNLIANLSTPASTGHNLFGIFCGTVGTGINLSFNTVYLNATSTGTNFASSAVFMSSTTPTVTLRNNILVNTSTPTGTGITAVIRRTSTALSTYGATSDRNDLYAGTPSAANVLYFDGTNSYQTLATLQPAVVAREAYSLSLMPNFLSTSGSSSDFLHIDAAIATQLESAGSAVAGITTDYDGNVRNATTPDIGADEFNGISPAPVLVSLTVLPATPQCIATARTISVSASTAGSPITSVTINYNNGTAASASMTLTSGTTTNGVWTGIIPAASPANANVTWNVVATDGVYSTQMNGTNYKDAYLTNAVATIAASNSTICAGASTTLSVSAIDGAAGIVDIGTQTTTISGSPGNPYRTSNTVGNQIRTQMLVLASELSAQGLSTGPITSLGFTTTSAAGTVVNFVINVGHTSATSISTSYLSIPMTNVFNLASFSPAVGLNTHTFTTPFIWDGTSNILVEVCQQQSVIGSSAVATFNPGFGSNIGNAAVGGCSAATGTAATSRPIMRFGGIVGINYTPTITWTWTPTGTGTGSSVSVSPTMNTSYSASGVDGNGCTTASSPFLVTVNALPSTPSATPSTQCGAGIPTASVASTAGVNGNGTFYWYDAPAGGTLLQGMAFNNTLSTYYFNDFSSATLTNASLSGSAAISGGSLVLHTAATSLAGGFTVNASGANATMFETGFDLSLTATGTSMADGFSYSFGDDALATTTNPTAKHGSGSKLRIGFFTYNAVSGSDGKGIYLMYNVAATTGYTAATPGVLAYSTDLSWLPVAAGTVTSRVTATINSQGQLTLSVGGTPIFTNVQLPAAFLAADKSTWKHVFSSRSGGVAGGFGMDSLEIKTNAPIPGYTTYQSSISATDTFYVSEAGVNGCESARVPVIATVTAPDAVTASSPSTPACQNAPITLNAAQTGSSNTYVYSWTGSPALGSGISTPVTGASVSITPTLPGTYVYTVAAYDAALGCNTSATVNVTVAPQPGSLTASASQAQICAGDSINLTASSVATSAPLVLLNENFNGATNGWTTTNLSTLGATPAATAWALISSPSTLWSESLSSPGASQFYLSNSDAGGSGNSTHTILQSPMINASGTSSLSLDFYHYYKYWNTNDSAFIEASTDGLNWTVVQNFSQSAVSVGAPANFAAANVSLNAFAGSPSLYVRFRYRAIWGYGWAVDSVRLSGVVDDAIAWTSIPSGYNASGASQTAVKPTTTTTYIATASNSYGCTDTAQASVVVNSPSVFALADVNTVCAVTPFNLTANVLFSDFNTASNSWTTINNSTGGTPANAAWTLRTSPYVYSSVNFSSNDGSQFYFSNSDAQGSGGTTRTILQSAAFSTVGMTSLSLDFNHYFRAITGDSANVEVSTDGTNWVLAQAFTTTFGSPAAFVPASVNLGAYTGNPSVYVRLRYKAIYGWYWGVDNIKVSGTSTNTYAWSASPVGFTSGLQNPTGVTATDTTIYTVSVTDGNSCTATSSVTVNVQDQIAVNTVGMPQTICSGSAPAPLAGSTPTGGSGTYTYLWQSSTLNGTSGFAASAGTNNDTNYAPAALTATTWFRRVIVSGSCSDTSAAVEITVTPGIVNNTISAPQSICAASVPALLVGSTPAGAAGPYSYVWLSSTTGASSGFAVATGTSGAIDYTSPALSATTWFRRVANSGSCTDTSAAVEISVSQPISGNTISGSQAICSGGVVAPLTGNITGISEDFNGLTGTGGLTTALLPSGWTMALNQGNLATGFNTNSYGRPAPTGAIRINNYSVGSGNVARMDTKVFGPSVSGDSLRFDVAYAAYEDGFGPYSDTVRIYANSGSGFTLLKQYVTGLNVDTSENGLNTAPFGTAAFVPTATQWARKKLSLPAGTTNVRFEFASGFGNRMYLDRIQADSAAFTWLSSTTSATSGFAVASGANTNTGYNPGAVAQTTWYRRVATTGGPCAPDTSAAVVLNVSSPITGNTISANQTVCNGSTPAPLTGSHAGLDEDFNGLTGTGGLSTALMPSGWTVPLNQGNLATGFSTNSYGRPTATGAIRINNYNVGVGNVARVDTKVFGPSLSGDSLRFDVAYGAYEDGFGPYSDTVRIYANTGSGFTLLKQYVTGLNVDTSDNGLNTAPFGTAAFVPTATQWTKKKLSLPAGTTNVRFEFASGFGNRMYIDRIQTDSAMFTWLSSTTSATSGFAAATGANTASGYAPGAITQNTWYKRVIATAGPCPSDTSAVVAITVNTPATITAQPAPTVSVCSTNNFMLNVTATNGTGYQWYRGTTMLSNGGNVTGANSDTLYITNASTSDAGTYTVVVTSTAGCDNDTSTNSVVSVNALGTLAANNSNGTYVHSDGITNLYTDASCNPILRIQDGTGGNTLGSVTANVSVTTTVQNAANGQKYLQRSFTVTPTSNGAAIVTLYALQSEFTAYNAAPGAYPNMPATGSNSDPNIPNIRITKYAGSPFVGGGNALLINPSAVVWNSAMNWWEITFPVTSFSSFYIHTGTIGPLAIDIEQISAVNVGNRNRVDWTTANETNADKFEVERSLDGESFEYIGTVKASGEPSTYSFWDELPFDGLNYYRLKMIDQSGKFSYSSTVNAFVKTNSTFVVQAYPNPVSEKLTVKVNGKISDNAYIILTDMAGKIILQQEVKEAETVIDMNRVAQGVYFMKYIDDKHSQTIKVNRN